MNDNNDEKRITYTEEDGAFLVELARKTIKKYLSIKETFEIPDDIPDKMSEKSGVFVTLNKIDPKTGKKELRGCIGYPRPIFPLIEATIQAAKNAAINDPRFPPVELNELDEIVIELSILTPPRIMEVQKPEDYFKKIKIGRDGLIIRRGSWSGLLLPQVPVEWNWTKEEFLNHTCSKAGLPGDCWKKKDTEVFVFSGIIFQEKEPNGEIVQKEM
jgi:hypothetical protein